MFTKLYTKMKTGKYVRFLMLMFFAVLLFKACEPESAVTRDELTGTWTCAETGFSTFTVTISASSSDVNRINISNFNNLGKSVFVYADISGSSIIIPNQTADGFEISGSGSISDVNSMKMTYSVNDGAETEHVTATFTR